MNNLNYIYILYLYNIKQLKRSIKEFFNDFQFKLIYN